MHGFRCGLLSLQIVGLNTLIENLFQNKGVFVISSRNSKYLNFVEDLLSSFWLPSFHSVGNKSKKYFAYYGNQRWLK